MKQITYYLKIVCLSLLMARGGVLKAQMHMSGMDHGTSPAGKNVYLLMMDSMMVEMGKAPTPSTYETDFINQMISHHEGAIAMAKYEIKHGRNKEMVQLAKSIFTEQTSEIEQMRLWLSKPGTHIPDIASYAHEMNGTMETMMVTMPAEASLSDIDQAFARVMIPHHQAAIDMAKVLLKYARQPTLPAYANLLIANEQVEIEQMKKFIN